MTRIYLPATFSTLAALHSAGEVSTASAHAVTAALRDWYEGVDEEDLEYVAFCNAAADAFGRLAEEIDAVPRRVVIAADMPARHVDVSDTEAHSGVSVAETVPLANVAAVHVDGTEAGEAVSAAVLALKSAAVDPAGAQEALAEADDFELEWYDPTELAQLVEQP